MKKIVLSIFSVVALVAMNACKDDSGFIENPVQTGDEITFGSSLPEDIQSRTIYGTPDAEKRVFPVYWEDGDEIAIYCPQASMPATKLARYRISADPNSSTATAVTRIGDAGLQWGSDADLHKFYAFYPSSGVEGTESTGLFDLEIPVNQDVKKFYLDKDGNWQADINMDLALMYAYRGQKKSNTAVGTNIDLHFKPLSTILEIVVQGPENAKEALTLTNINVETVDAEKTPIVGQFHAQITPGSDTDEVYTEGSTVTFSTMNKDKVVNNLSIECSWKENGETKFVTLGQGQKLYVKAFMLPTQEIDSKNIKITVSTTKGAVHKTLVNGDKSFTIAQHKVNRVTLPALETSFDNAYWMNSLDPNIYLTELSIPGSKMTVETTENGASEVYQATTIEQQYKDGVRAFILQTERHDPWFSDAYIRLARTGARLTEVLNDISSYLIDSKNKGKNEFAFVLITYQDGDGSQKDWMDLLQTTINNISGDIIYKDEVNPETTLGDVFGKIVVKCNYNSTDMIDGSGTAPMLYTIWKTPYVENGLPMPWSNPRATDAKLTWLYQEVTSVLEESKNKCNDYSAESSIASKRNYISTLFNKSLEEYKYGNHDTWFMNDLGGAYAWCYRSHLIPDNHSLNFDVVTLTKELNQLGIDELQNRAENAGLGLIFMNFANRGTTGQECKSDLLLQTIIDNNFKFALRKKVDSNSKTYSAEYKDGGNAIGWDN